jgi:hypothetical protein
MTSSEQRLAALEGAFEEEVERRMEEEFTEMLGLLEERLDRETFIRVARILASAASPGGSIAETSVYEEMPGYQSEWW